MNNKNKVYGVAFSDVGSQVAMYRYRNALSGIRPIRRRLTLSSFHRLTGVLKARGWKFDYFSQMYKEYEAG